MIDDDSSDRRVPRLRAVRRRWRGRSPFSLRERFLSSTLTLVIPDRPVPEDTGRQHRARPKGAERVLAQADARRARGAPIRWQTRRTRRAEQTRLPAQNHRSLPTIDWLPNPRILAVIPHLAGEAWLRDCLESMVAQTRRLDGVVVIDDASPFPPVGIVSDFPEVTLLTASERCGPANILQSVMNLGGFDAYLLQDADDWATVDRLERLLGVAMATGAEMVGSQEIRVIGNDVELWGYPTDVNAALDTGATHALLGATSLVHADLVRRVGGMATGLRFGADTEFLLRAHFVGRIVNAPDYLYFRRIHPKSLTQAPSTGTGSPARASVAAAIAAASDDRYRARERGDPVDLAPLAVAPPASLRHVAGPTIFDG